MNWIEVSPLLGFTYLSVLVLIKSVLLKSKGIQINSGHNEPFRLKSIFYLAFFLILLWIFELANQAFQFFVFPQALIHTFLQSGIFKVSGLIIIFFALVLFTVTLIHFGNSFRFGLNEINQGKLVTRGIFSISRNPFFLSLDLFFLGTAILFPNLFFIIYATLVITTIHFFILKEEKFLQKVYGKEYTKYSDRVGRYFSL